MALTSGRLTERLKEAVSKPGNFGEVCYLIEKGADVSNLASHLFGYYSRSVNILIVAVHKAGLPMVRLLMEKYQIYDKMVWDPFMVMQLYRIIVFNNDFDMGIYLLNFTDPYGNKVIPRPPPDFQFIVASNAEQAKFIHDVLNIKTYENDSHMFYNAMVWGDVDEKQRQNMIHYMIRSRQFNDFYTFNSKKREEPGFPDAKSLL